MKQLDPTVREPGVAPTLEPTPDPTPVEMVYEGEVPIISAATGGSVIPGQKVCVDAGQVEGLLAAGFKVVK